MIQQMFMAQSAPAGPASPVTFTAPGSFTVPAGVSSVTVKIFGAGGSNEAGYFGDTEGGSGAYIIGNYAVQSGDIIHIYNAGVQTSYASGATWKRGATVMGWAVAGAGGAAGTPGDDGGDAWSGRFGGAGGNAGVLNGSADSGSGGDAGAGATTTSAGSGGGNGNGGGGPATSSGAAGAAVGGNGYSGGNASGGNGGYGGGGYYGGGAGGGGYGREDYPDSADGGGGGGGGSSYESGNMTSRTNGLCVNSSDSNRGTAGNPGETGKVVLVF